MEIPPSMYIYIYIYLYLHIFIYIYIWMIFPATKAAWMVRWFPSHVGSPEGSSHLPRTTNLSDAVWCSLEASNLRNHMGLPPNFDKQICEFSLSEQFKSTPTSLHLTWIIAHCSWLHQVRFFLPESRGSRKLVPPNPCVYHHFPCILLAISVLAIQE